MYFQFSEEQERLRHEIRDFLDRELPPGWVGAELIPEQQFETDEYWAFCRSLRRKMGEKGWHSLCWPKEYGGQERSRVEYAILREEICLRGAPGFDGVGSMMLSPVLLAYGTEEQKRRHLPPIARGEIQWCQGFSEPNAGSDLASLTMRAVEDGDYFILDGEKCWTGLAERAGWGFFLVRTDPSAAKHKGLSFMLVDMKTPGITISPVYNLLGLHHWNEVFFDGVRVPRENLMGEKNQGWYMATTLLNNERVGIEACAACKRALDWLTKYVKEKESPAENPIIRQELASFATEIEVSRLLCYHTAWMQDRGLDPVHEASMGKSFASKLMARITEAGSQVLGLYGQLTEGSKWAPLDGLIERACLTYPSWTLAAGSPEIQKNIIATIGLGLPR